MLCNATLWMVKLQMKIDNRTNMKIQSKMKDKNEKKKKTKLNA